MILTLDQFIPHLSLFKDKDLLIPLEASRVLLIITELLIDHTVDLVLLKFLSRFLTQQSYDDIVEEKNIEHQCGYVTCDRLPLSRPLRRRSSTGSEGRFQIYARKPSIILPNTYTSQFCCKEHYQALTFFRNQLSNEALFARKDIMVTAPFPENRAWYENKITCLEEVLQKHRELKDEGKSLADVITLMNGLSVDDNADTSELIKMIEDFEIVEKEGGLEGDDDDDDDEAPASNAIEGYITTNRAWGGYVV